MVLASGVRIEYVEQGDRSGIPVVLLHGYTDSWHSWEPVLPLLPSSLRAFALTQRGHGDSDRPQSGYLPADFAADAAQFMDAMGLSKAVIVGHSMGGIVAQRFARDYPERVLGLVLSGTFATLRGSPILEEFWDESIALLQDPIDPQFALEFQQSTMTRPVPPAFLETVVQESLKVPPRVWLDIMRGLLATDFSAERGRIAAPTLIVWGDQDAFSPLSEQELLRSAIPGSELVTYAGTGHAIHWEEPGRFATDLIEFVTRTHQGL